MYITICILNVCYLRFISLISRFQMDFRCQRAQGAVRGWRPENRWRKNARDLDPNFQTESPKCLEYA